MSKPKRTLKAYLLFPYRWMVATGNFNVLLVFIGTFIITGAVVFYFEHSIGKNKQFQSIWDGIWWGIVSITTTGYGDKVPTTLGGRLTAALTMCTGIVLAGIVTGNIASWLVDLKLKEGRGLINLAGKSGHLVICGWKREMPTILEEILRLNTDLKPEDIVIIAPVTQETLERFKADEAFEKVNVLRGDYFTQTMLEHASIKLAGKVLIVADWSIPTQSLTSIDAKTVMTAMTIRKMAPTVYIAAEVIDPKLDPYLKLAHCDEVMHTRDYSRALLANCAGRTGFAHIFYDLLTIDTPTQISTVPVPPALIGKPFSEISAYYKRLSGSITIGILENAGNLNRMRQEALTEAQKNPDTRQVLRNLKDVKTLESNNPILNPQRDYIIRKNTLAVLIGTRDKPQDKPLNKKEVLS